MQYLIKGEDTLGNGFVFGYGATDLLGSLPSQFDHVLFCLPPGTRGEWYVLMDHV